MNRDGWRVLVKGLSVVAGVAAFVAGLASVVVAQVLEGYQSNALGAWVAAIVFTLAGVALCAWPWLLWMPSSSADEIDAGLLK